METNQSVQEFLNTDDPSKEIIINAYNVRDNYYDVNNAAQRYEHMKKLGIDLENINNYKKEKQDKFVKKYIKNLYENNSEDSFSFDQIKEIYYQSDDYKLVEKKVNKLIERYNHLKEYLHGSNIAFYQQLTKEELEYLGW